jgi:hypothetical protein
MLAPFLPSQEWQSIQKGFWRSYAVLDSRFHGNDKKVKAPWSRNDVKAGIHASFVDSAARKSFQKWRKNCEAMWISNIEIPRPDSGEIPAPLHPFRMRRRFRQG